MSYFIKLPDVIKYKIQNSYYKPLNREIAEELKQNYKFIKLSFNERKYLKKLLSSIITSPIIEDYLINEYLYIDILNIELHINECLYIYFNLLQHHKYGTNLIRTYRNPNKYYENYINEKFSIIYENY